MNSLKGYHISIVFIFFVTETKADFKNHENCGLKTSKFIVGGTHAEKNEFPFMVSLQYKNRHFCGGSILNSRWVLTAAHCIQIPVMLQRFRFPSDLELFIGGIDNQNNKSEFRYKVHKWIIHGCFLAKFGDRLSDDITLLKTDRDIDLKKLHVVPICLPPKYAEPISYDITIAGWGVWSESNMFTDEKPPKKLQKAKTKIVSEEYCQSYHSFRNIGIKIWPLGTRICLRAMESTACRGDSGGPAFQEVEGRIYQFGIASFISMTIPVGNQCFKSNPVLYLKTSHYVDWITESINKYSDDKNKITVKTKC